MDQLPQELVDKICRYLPKADLKNVLTLTSKFQYASERYSGTFSEFTIDDSNAKTFLELYSSHRILYLREVVFRPSLAPIVEPDDYHEHCRENSDKLREKDEQFSNRIRTLFDVLQILEDQASEKYTLGRYRLSIYHPTRIGHISHECNHHLFVSWRIHLLEVDKLPQIHSVQSLVVYDNSEGDWPRLDGRVSIDLATRFPNLEFFDIRTGGYEWYPKMEDEEPAKHYEHDWEGPRRDSRHDFATAVTSYISQFPSSLKRASLDFLSPLERTTNIHHYMALPDLVSPLQRDPFSSSLCLISTNLRQLRICAMVDDSLFGSGDGDPPFGPNLEIFEVMFHLARPDGKWYFQGPSGEGHDAVGYSVTDTCYPPLELTHTDIIMDELQAERPCGCDEYANCRFRISPNDTNLRSFLEGFAKATVQMRSLKKALLWSPMRWYVDEDYEHIFSKYNFEAHDRLVWGIAYESGGHVSCRKLTWVVAQWRPDPDLHNVFQQIGRTEYGDELEELWEQDVFEDSPQYRNWFHNFVFGRDAGRIVGSY
jgi:hypothetical protein